MEHIDVFNKHGGYVRTYSSDTHGEDFLDLAREFAGKIGGDLGYRTRFGFEPYVEEEEEEESPEPAEEQEKPAPKKRAAAKKAAPKKRTLSDDEKTNDA
jgi:hypothetical protein